MKARSKHRFLCALLAVLMIVSLLPTAALAAEVETSTWEKVALADITADDTVAITMTKGEDVFALPATQASSAPKVNAEISVSAAESALEIGAPSADFGWKLTPGEAEGTFTLQNENGDFLYVTAANAGVRVGTPQQGKEETAVFSVVNSYLRASDGTNMRYIGVYYNQDTGVPQDWRCYKVGSDGAPGSNIAGQTVSFWKLVDGESTDPSPSVDPTTEPSPAVMPVTVAEALAGETNKAFTVKGVVTMIESKNVFVQDATGGICLYLTAAPTDLALGDTVIGSGTRGVHNGLPQLSNATYTKDTGLTLTAKETTIGALTTADVCTYVQLKDLEVTQIVDKDKNGNPYTNPNITVKDADGNTIQIYKAVVNKVDDAWTVKVGDKLDVKAAVGIYNTTLQLRNTLASEITVQAEPYADIAKNLSVYEKTAEISDGDRVVIFNAGNGQAVSSVIKASYYLTGEAVTPEAERGIITSDVEAIEWTVKVNEDGTYTFSQGDKVLAGKQSQNADGTKTYNNITLSADDQSDWTLVSCNAENASYYLRNDAMVSKYADEGGHIYLNWYAQYTEFSLNDTSRQSEQNYGMTFYKLVREKTVETPDDQLAATYTLTDTPADGAQVVLVNAASNKAINSTVISTNYLGGSDVAPKNSKIQNPDAGAVWTVKVNSDGTYTFTQGDKTLAAYQRTNSEGKIYNNLSLKSTDKTDWTLEAASAAKSFYVYNDAIPSSKEGGHIYLEWYSNYSEFCAFDYARPGTDGRFIMQFYAYSGEEPLDPDEPAETSGLGELVKSLDQLDGKTVLIYNPATENAISSQPNGDWYLKPSPVFETDAETGEKTAKFTEDLVWTVSVKDGVYTFSHGENSITAWLSEGTVNGQPKTFIELSVDSAQYPDNGWKLTTCNAANHTWYISSSTLKVEKRDCYIEAFERNLNPVFSGYAPYADKLNEAQYGMQFYIVDAANAQQPFDDGVWDGVLKKGQQTVIYNVDAKASVGLQDEANYSMKAIPTTISGDKAKPGNGAYVFTVDTTGRYYTFKTGDRYLATNDAEELLLIAPNADGSVPETAKWFLKQDSEHGDAANGTYVVFNKAANYKGQPVCIEYYSSVFSGWSYKSDSETPDIFRFKFYPIADDAKVYGDIVQDPQVLFDGEDIRYIEQDYAAEVTLDDLAPEIMSVQFTYKVGDKTGEITNVTGSDRNYSFTIPAADLDTENGETSFKVIATVTNSYGITYTGEKTVQIVDEPFFSAMTPRPNSQTRDDMRPVISVKVGNVGDNPTFLMQVNGETVEATFENGVLSYKPDADLPEGRTTVYVSVERADVVTAEKHWAFIAGYSEFQHYFGQLHSHTTYSDGSGTLDTALSYIASLPERANVQFVAFTDHSNYFDSTSAANPADALNDQSLMTAASRDKWNEYKSKVAAFNAKQTDIVAIAGFEMTWSGGPGHINTYDSDGIVSRNNASLNNKTGDAGMKLYYDTINKGESLNQFNHPGTTFGNFADFNYWSEETDAHMFLVEVGNGEGQIGQGGYYPSYEQYILALDKGWHVAPTNNQDNHKGRWGNANDARDVVLANDFSEQGIYEAIRNLRVYATEDKNLDLNYTVNEQPMGTIFAEKPEALEVKVDFYDSDSRDRITKVELVANSGKVAYTWDQSSELATGEVTATIENPKYTYYFVRVTQKDGDLAVTSPVWVGKGINVGIQDVKCVTAQPIVNEDVTLTTTLFNAQDTEVTVKSLTYTTDGSKVLKTDTTERTIPANGSIDVDFTYKPTVAKRTTVKVTAVIVVNDIELTYTKDVTFSVRENAGELPISDIKVVQAQTESGYEYAIEGVVTSNASGYDKDTAFFDCIYVQDDTAGICCFPVSGEFKIGDKVHIEGYTDFYQGEAELQVEKIEIIGSGEVAPTETTAAAVNDGSVLGSLITVKGTVESFEVVNGLVQTIMVKDENGDVVRVFIDGYITTGKEVENLAVGCAVTVTGLASYDDTFNAPEGPFPRIRIRDRADVVCTPQGCDGGENCPSKHFEDVDHGPDSWMHEPIDWAVVNKITMGTSPTTFSPNNECTRGEAVTFLWRAAGCPDPETTENPFTDVADDAFYLKPVLWAVENEITLGTGDGKFSPNDKCTRSQIVTFLWRMHDKPEAEEACTFTDVAADAWYFGAVSWAVENGITKGTGDGTTFEPDAYCIRSQIVAFLYRDLG